MPTPASDLGNSTVDWPPLVIEAGKTRGLPGLLHLGEVWRYRELLYFLALRDLQLRYRQTLLGVAWALVQPLLTTAVFWLFLGRFAGLEEKTGGVPYPLQVYCALVLWTFFSNSVAASATSVVNSASLVTKVYFPRLIIPLAAVAGTVVDLLVSCLVLIVILSLAGFGLSFQALVVPLFILGSAVTAIGAGALLAALTVAYRDFRYVVPFGLQIWMFITPVVYPPGVVPEQWRLALALNPMAGFVEGFQAAFLALPFPWLSICLSLFIAALLLVLGATYFCAVERSFADII